MIRTVTLLKLGVAALGIGVVAFVASVGCQSPSEKPDEPTTSQPQPTTKRGLFGSAPNRSGAELWAQTCNQCHNARPTEYYSDAQWDLIVHHMRLRADLTGEDARKIEEFLKAAN